MLRFLLVAAVGLYAVGASAEPTLRLDGEVEWDLFWYPCSCDDAVAGRNQIRFEPRLKAKAGKVGAVVQLQLRHDFLDTDRSRILLKDAYAQVRWKGLKLRAGNQSIRWGRMDMRPALDLLTPRDYDELWAPERLAAPALLLSYWHPNFAASLAWLPTFSPSLYPVTDHHRWNVLLPQPHEAVVGSIQPNPPITYVAYHELQSDYVGGFNNSQLGLRLEWFLPQVDLALQGYWGRDLLPTYHVYEPAEGEGDFMDPSAQDLIKLVDGVDVELFPIFSHKGVIGGDMALVLGRVVLKGELAYTITTDAAHEHCDVPDPYLQGTVGLEWIANDLVGKQDLQVRVEVAGDHELPPSSDGVINRDAHCDLPATATPIIDVNHLSVLSFFGNVQWSFTDDLVLDLRGFVAVEGDYLVRAELAFTVHDRVRLGLAGLLVGGGIFMDAYERNDRVEFTTTYMF